MEENNWKTWPTENVLNEKGYSMLPNAIRNLYGSVNIFREKLYEELGIQDKNDKLESLLEDYASD